MGYALPKRTLPNPIDITLVFAQKVRTYSLLLKSNFHLNELVSITGILVCTVADVPYSLLHTKQGALVVIGFKIVNILSGFPNRLHTDGGHHSVFLLLFHGRITAHRYLVLLDKSKRFMLVKNYELN